MTCRQEFAGNFMTTVSHRKCRDLPRLATHERCQVQECARWKVIGDWSEVSGSGTLVDPFSLTCQVNFELCSQCTASCGAGKKQRQVVCVAGDDEVVPDNQCPTSARPQHVKSCSSGPCITRWFLSEWDEVGLDFINSSGLKTEYPRKNNEYAKKKLSFLKSGFEFYVFKLCTKSES